MDLNCFFEALEEVASKLFQNKLSVLENLSELIQIVIGQL